MRNVKRNSEELEEQRNSLAGVEQTRGEESESSRTRAQLLQQMNYLRATEERIQKQVIFITTLWRHLREIEILGHYSG